MAQSCLLQLFNVSNDRDVAMVTRIPRHEECIQSIHFIHNSISNLLHDISKNKIRHQHKTRTTQTQSTCGVFLIQK